MIPFEFEYLRPKSVREAVGAFQQLTAAGKRPLYYAGGTEIVTGARQNKVRMDAVIDLKGIPELVEHGRDGDRLRFGAATSLSAITEANAWPLLSDCLGRIADHTSRVQITLGGNIAGEIPYREAVLPLWLADAEALVAGPAGLRRVPLDDVFDGTLHLRPGELVMQLAVDADVTRRLGVNVKQTRLDWIDYPLLTVSTLELDGRLRFAFAGLCAGPFRSQAMDDALSSRALPYEQRVEAALHRIPAPVLNDVHGSAEYRTFVLRHTLIDILQRLEG